MSEHQVETGQIDEADEVLDVVFPSGDKAAKVVHPGEEPLCLPASAIASELASIQTFASAPPIGRNQFDSSLQPASRRAGPSYRLRRRAVREFVEKPSGKSLFYKLALG
jgi:hypothetical protein